MNANAAVLTTFSSNINIGRRLIIKTLINFSNSETTQAEVEPIRDMTFETLHHEMGKPIQENLQRAEII